MRRFTGLSAIRPAEHGVSGERTNATRKVLVVDGDPEVRLAISTYFEDCHLPTSSASNRSELDWHIAAADPCVIVLNIGLGGAGGLDLLKGVRSKSDVPVIITSNDHLDEIDRIISFELGADDYLVKPFSPRELFVRVRAVLRRQELGRVARVRDTEGEDYRFGGWRLRCRSRQLVDPVGTILLLSRAEFALLLVFLLNPRQTLSRKNLLRAGRTHEDRCDRNIDVLIFRLRRKLEPGMIETQRGIGYTFTLPVESW